MMQSKRELWAGHVAAWQPSGLSQTAWCRGHRVSLASFGDWRGKLSAEVRSALPAVLPIRVDTPAHNVSSADAYDQATFCCFISMMEG